MQTIVGQSSDKSNVCFCSLYNSFYYIEKQHRFIAVLKRLKTDLERRTILSWILVLHLLSTASLISKTNSVTHEISSILDQQLQVTQTSLH